MEHFKQQLKIWAIVLATVMGVILYSEANATEVSLLGGLGFHSASMDPMPAGTTVKSKSAVMYGALLDFSLSPGLSLETGALMGADAIRLEVDSNNYVDFSQKHIRIPLVFRHHFNQMISLGVGGYYSISMGNSKSTTTAAGVTGAEVDSGSSQDSDYGLVGSLRFKIPLGTKFAIAVEGRYHYGLKSVGSGSSTAKFSDVDALGGIVWTL